MNAEDLAASRFRPIRVAREQIAKTEGAHRKAAEQLEALRGRLPQALSRDRSALAAALVDGQREPASEAETIQAEIVRQEQRVEALRLAAGEARGRVRTLARDNRKAWRGQAIRELTQAKRRYLETIEQLAAARQSLSDEASLVGWLDSGIGAEAANDQLGGPPSHADGRAPVSFTAVLEELRRDGEHLAGYPDTRSNPAPKVRPVASGMRSAPPSADWT
jgi:hypothetical protein